MADMQEKVFLCDCHSKEHQVWFVYDPDDTFEKELYIEVHLSKQNILRRIIYAIKYVFGYQSKYGAFTEVVLREAQVSELEDFLYVFRNGELT